MNGLTHGQELIAITAELQAMGQTFLGLSIPGSIGPVGETHLSAMSIPASRRYSFRPDPAQ